MLRTSPVDWPSNISLRLQRSRQLEFRGTESRGQDKRSLSYLAGERLPWIKNACLPDGAVCALQRQAKHARHAGYTVVSHTYDQLFCAPALSLPNPGWSNTISHSLLQS